MHGFFQFQLFFPIWKKIIKAHYAFRLIFPPETVGSGRKKRKNTLRLRSAKRVKYKKIHRSGKIKKAHCANRFQPIWLAVGSKGHIWVVTVSVCSVTVSVCPGTSSICVVTVAECAAKSHVQVAKTKKMWVYVPWPELSGTIQRTLGSPENYFHNLCKLEGLRPF